jgi:hypothetical protein
MFTDRLVAHRRQPSLLRAAFFAVLAPHHKISWATAAFALLALLAGLSLRTDDQQGTQLVLQTLIGFAVVGWWWIVASRALPLCMFLAAERAPRLAHAVAAALAGQLALSVLLPALLLVALGFDPLQALAGFALAAMFGLLLASSSTAGMLVLLVLLPVIAGLLPAELRGLLIGTALDRGPLPAALLLAGVNALLWIRWLRMDVTARRAAGPFALMLHHPDRNQAAAASDPLSRWLNTSRWSPRAATPRSRLQVALGRPFHHLGWSGAAIEMALHAGVIASWALFAAWGKLAPPMIAFFSGALILFIAAAPAMRLFALRNRPSAELAELPLLPGLPNATAARELATLVLQMQARSVLLALVMYGGFLVWHGASTALVLLMPMVAICAIPLGHVSALWVASHGSATLPLTAALAIGPLMFISSVMLDKATAGTHWIWLAWFAVGATAVLLIPPVRRRLWRAPHPFLVH